MLNIPVLKIMKGIKTTYSGTNKLIITQYTENKQKRDWAHRTLNSEAITQKPSHHDHLYNLQIKCKLEHKILFEG